jgi:NADH-quinone oxidoreductase subunit A
MNSGLHLHEYIPVGLILLSAIAFSAGTVLMSNLVGTRRTHNTIKDSPYECGMPPLADPHTRFSIKFYVVAMLFIVFDIEGVFLLGWAAVYKDLVKPVADGGIGWAMLWGTVIFLAILEIGHIYAWKKGALDWAPVRKNVRNT